MSPTFQPSHQRRPFYFSLVTKFLPALLLCLGAGSIPMLSTPAEALENVTLTYGKVQLQTIPVTDLERFAKTGEATPEIQSLLEVANVDKDTARAVLGNEVDVDGELLSLVSQTFLGETLLQQLGTAITRPDSSTQTWQDLRRAFLSAIADNQVSTLEVLQNFEGASVTVDAQQVEKVASTVQRTFRDIQSVMELLRSRQHQTSLQP